MEDTTLVKQKKRNYLNNHDLLIEIKKSKAKNNMTNDLVKMLMMLCDRYAKKSSYASYTYIDDMKSYALLNIVKIWRGFDETKYDNPFAYYTQSIKNSFIQYLNQEKRQRQVKDMLLVDQGLDPSHNYMLEYEEEHHHHFHGDAEFNPPSISDNFIHEWVETDPSEPFVDSSSYNFPPLTAVA